MTNEVNTTVTVRDDKKAEEVVNMLKSTGAKHINVSGNTISAVAEMRLINHLKALTGVSGVDATPIKENLEAKAQPEQVEVQPEVVVPVEVTPTVS